MQSFQFEGELFAPHKTADPPHACPEIACAGALATGQLVSPFSLKIKARGGYYLLRSRHKRPNPAMLAFTRWLNALLMRIGSELKGGPF